MLFEVRLYYCNGVVANSPEEMVFWLVSCNFRSTFLYAGTLGSVGKKNVVFMCLAGSGHPKALLTERRESPGWAGRVLLQSSLVACCKGTFYLLNKI
ncbi:MAG: hypothetical protein RLY57_723 [Candidatus Parcubacteria bacterium]|jgi:hypothetical protein